MLADLLKNGFGQAEDFNCAEKIIHGANRAYQLGLSPEALKLSGGFGGGMAVGRTCGAVAGAVMVISHIFIEDRAHASPRLKQVTQKFIEDYLREMSSLDCDELKEQHYSPDYRCRDIIVKAAELLDDIVRAERKL